MMKRKKSALYPELEELERQREALQRDIRELQIEHDLLKTASEMIKKELGGDLQGLSNREKTMLIVALKKRYKTPALLARLGLARSSYFYHRARMKLEDKYLPMRHAMGEAFESNHRCYGYRRLKTYMAREFISISEKVVRCLMKQNALIVPKPKLRRYSSYLGEISPAPENIINCFDGLVISWTIGTRPDADLVNTMLDAPVETIADSEPRPVVHSDRGGHYRWPGWLAGTNRRSKAHSFDVAKGEFARQCRM